MDGQLINCFAGCRLQTMAAAAPAHEATQAEEEAQEEEGGGSRRLPSMSARLLSVPLAV